MKATFANDAFVRPKESEGNHRYIEVPERRAVACTLDGNIMKTLYCLTFDGQMGDIGTGKRVSRIETVSAGIAGSSPKPTRHNNRRR